MKTICSLVTLMGLLLGSGFQTQAVPNLSPAPVSSTNQLFYLQRSKDANIVVYEANLTTGSRFNAGKPVTVYWLRYAEQGQREDLTRLQWQLAYGYHHTPSPEAGSFDIWLNAFRQRSLQIAFQGGKPVAITLIAGRRSCLQRVFVQVDPKPRLVPRVEFLQLYGVDYCTGQAVTERIVPRQPGD